MGHSKNNSHESQPITTIPILPLPPNRLLFPKQSLNKVQLDPLSSNQLIKLHRERQDRNQVRALIIGFVPHKSFVQLPNKSLTTPLRSYYLKLINLSSSPIISDASRDHPSPELSVTTWPSDDSIEATSRANRRPSVNDLYDWGCLARVIRIEQRSVRNDTYPNTPLDSDLLISLDLVGIHRFRIDRYLQIGNPVYQAQISRHEDIPFAISPVEKKHVNQLLQTFKNSSLKFINLIGLTDNLNRSRTLSASHRQPGTAQLNPDPKKLEIEGLIKNLKPDQLSLFIDLMIANIEFIDWSDKLEFLTYYQLELKVVRSIELMDRLNGQIQSFSQQARSSSKLDPHTHSLNNIKDLDLIKLFADHQHLSPQQRHILLSRKLQSIQDELNILDSHYNLQNPQIQSIINRFMQINKPIPRFVTNSQQVGQLPGFQRIMLPTGFDPRMAMGGRPPFNQSFRRENDSEDDEITELEKRVKSAGMQAEALKICIKELKRLRMIPHSSVEHSVIRNYLDIMLEVPWSRTTSSDKDILNFNKGFLDRAREQLESDHYGMMKVKQRLIEFLAVIKLRHDLNVRALAESQKDNTALSGTDGQTPPHLTPLQSAQEHPQHTITEKEINQIFSNDAVPDSSSGTLIAIHPKLSKPQVNEVLPEPLLPHKARAKDKAPILLLVGPPGVGKTSIAQSLAKTLGKKFYRISLGGVKDESEIRGHRRTYVGSMPGAIVQALRRVGVNDPLILLDEIDKVGQQNFHGDPSAALLEVLDPEQNSSFVDHYINTPIDLSSVLFIGTANNLSTITRPLLDRMEVIELDGYSYEEKVQIAKRNLIPKQILNYNLKKDEQIQFEDEERLLRKLILSYTRESGVRGLERQIGNLCRSKVIELVEYNESRSSEQNRKGGELILMESEKFDPLIKLKDLERILGPERYEEEVPDKDEMRPGVAIGMAYQGSGNGSILFIESDLYKGKGNLTLTGSLGEVIKESAELALSWIKANYNRLKIEEEQIERMIKSDVHIHFPSGSVRKDGPSAGVGLVISLVSLLTQISIDNRLAVTGEISLRGKVLPVGGIKEKVLAAHRAGIRHIILPYKNQRDIEEDENLKRMKKEIKIEFVKSLDEVIDIVFGRETSIDLTGNPEFVRSSGEHRVKKISRHFDSRL